MCLEVCYKMRGHSIPESQSKKVQVAWGSWLQLGRSWHNPVLFFYTALCNLMYCCSGYKYLIIMPSRKYLCAKKTTTIKYLYKVYILGV